MANKYKKRPQREEAPSPWVNPEEPEAPFHPQAKLAHLKVSPKTVNQKSYLDAMDNFKLVFGIGPAGTGKTYLAVAKAITWLAKKGNKLVIARPAVEAGERLGFLPGSLQEKVDPYLRPIYDALFDMMPPQQVEHYMEIGRIEIAPLAFIRGRTFNHSFVIFDEAQNSTQEQMKMMLTRLGAESKMVVNGDDTQIDLPVKSKSGLFDAENVLRDKSPNIFFQDFEEVDIVRDPLVQEICHLYEEAENEPVP